ncbi:hypothetical protein NL676_038982 [Syzygium grande]|nr:hypothetical protein NL676_038982 [Syzygium grande]
MAALGAGLGDMKAFSGFNMSLLLCLAFVLFYSGSGQVTQAVFNDVYYDASAPTQARSNS